MATTINGTTGRNSNYWKYYLVCTEQDVSVANNTSKLKVDVYLGATSYSRAVRGSITATHTVTINGTNYTFTTGAYTIEKNTNILLGSVTSNAITHNADGSKSVTVSASSPDLAQSSGYGPYSGSVSGQVTLTTIARASSVTCADGNIGSATTININRASSSFTHTLKYAFGSLSGTIVAKTSNTSYGWTIPTSFYAQIPNTKSGQGTITCETYNGSTLIGTKTCTFNAIVLETNNKPTITATVTDINTTITALTGDANKLVKYFSNAKVTITATAKNSATIVSKKVTCRDGKSSTTSPATLNSVESGTFDLITTDSRGNTGTNTINKTMVNYIKLAITSLTIERESSTSNTVKINLSGNYFNSSFGSVTNTLLLKWRYRLKAGTWSGYTTVTATKSGNTFSYNGTLGTTFNYQEAYEFEIVAQDKLITEIKNKEVTTGTPLIDMWLNNLKINGNLTATSAKINENLKLSGTLISKGYFLFALNGMNDPRRYYKLCNIKASDSQNAVTVNIKGSIGNFTTSKGTIDIQISNRGGLKVYGNYIGANTLFDYQTIVIYKESDNSHTVYLRNVAEYTGPNVLEIFYGQSYNYATIYTDYSYVTSPPSGTLAWTSSISTVGNSNGRNILYINYDGTTGTLTLDETAENFSMLEIHYGDSDHIVSMRISNPNGKKTTLPYHFYTGGFAQVEFKEVLISGTSVTYLNSYYFHKDAQGESNDLKIYRVFGYR